MTLKLGNIRRMTNLGWTPWHVVAAVVMAAIGAWVTRTAWQDIIEIASRDEESSHIVLVPFVAAWLFYSRRVRVRMCRPTGQWVGPLLAGLGWWMYVYGSNSAQQAFWHGGALAVVVGCVLAVIGKDALFRFLPCFVVLAFVIPVPGRIRHAIAGPLQEATAWLTQAIFETFGTAVERSGNVLSINGNLVAVAEACNGMRMVFALVLVSFAFAYSYPLRNGVRLLILLSSPLAALFCNLVRLIPTVYLYGFSTKPLADGFHDVSGWVMLPVAFVLLLGIIRVLRWALVPVARFNLAYQ